MAQIWYDLYIFMMFTVVKCRGHTNFDEAKYRCDVKVEISENSFCILVDLN